MAWSLLYLHGVGQSVHTDQWFHSLARSLGELGVDLPALESDRILVPTYDDLLISGEPERTDEPPRTVPFDGDATELLALRARWTRDQTRVVNDLPEYTGAGLKGWGQSLDPTTNAALKRANRDFEQARRYLTDPALRAAVLHRVLAAIGDQRDLVVVAHSLGSVVAIDLMNHLPAQVRIRRLVTVGSPAGTQGFHRSGPQRLLEAKNFPFHQVDSWINVFSPLDPITFGRGLAGLFPAASDVRIDLPRWEHASALYLAHPVLARIVAEAVRPVVLGAGGDAPGTELESALDQDEAIALDQLVFGTLVRERLGRGSERRERFAQALTDVAAQVGQQLCERRRVDRRPVPQKIRSAAAGDLAGLSITERPLDEQLLFAVVAGTNNPIAPYEIAAAKETEAAVRDLWLALGHPVSHAERVTRALREAAKVFDPSGSWKWVALGAAGLALIAVPPVGIAVGAVGGAVGTAGVAGGTAFTAALAAFGPGGAIGGMALASGLIGLGSMSVAASVRLPGTLTLDQLQTHLVRYLAFARGHQLLGLPGLPLEVWFTIAQWYDETSAEIADLALYSDENAAAVKAARAKLDLLRKSLARLTDWGLSPHLDR